MRVNWHIYSGVYRRQHGYTPDWYDGVPTVIVDVNLNDWALPLSVHAGGPLLGKPGLTFRVGPANIGWSWL